MKSADHLFPYINEVVRKFYFWGLDLIVLPIGTEDSDYRKPDKSVRPSRGLSDGKSADL